MMVLLLLLVVLGITYQIVHLQRPSMPGPGIAEAVGGQIGASSSVAVGIMIHN